MSKQFQAMAGEHPVEAAIREGKIPESRRDFYMAKHAKRPKATAKLLAKLEAVLEPPEEMAAVAQYVQGSGQAAPAGQTASGPSDYPKEWLELTGAKGRPVPGSITFEDDLGPYGAVSEELR